MNFWKSDAQFHHNELQFQTDSALLRSHPQGSCISCVLYSDIGSWKDAGCFQNYCFHSVITRHLSVSMRKMC